MAADSGPLVGARVIVTRAVAQAGGLVEALQKEGAAVVRLPLLEMLPPRDPTPLQRSVSRIPEFDWLIFTSANAVEALLSLRPGPLPEGLRVASIGAATTRALARSGVAPRVIAEDSRAEGLLAALRSHLRPRERALLPQAADARPLLAQGLAEAGLEVLVVEAYRKGIPEASRAQMPELLEQGPLGWATFTSPSTANHFRELVGEAWTERRVELRAASIGPVTSAALRQLGVEPAAEAKQASDAGLVEAILDALALPGSR